MIKNIILDFGDIFINLDKKATTKALANLGVTKITDEIKAILHQYEKGLISTEDFTQFFKDTFNISQEKFIKIWNAVLLDFPEERLVFLEELANSKKYRLFLLSNTNDLHIKWVKNSLGAKFYNDFKSCFEKFYLSYKIHFKKPDTDIYQFVLNENNLIPEETLFVDDLKENTEAAKSLGIQTWNLIPEKDDVTQLFNKKYFLN